MNFAADFLPIKGDPRGAELLKWSRGSNSAATKSYEGAAGRPILYPGVCCVKSYVSKRTHRWVRILGVGTFGREGNMPTLPPTYPPVGTFRNVTFYTTDPRSQTTFCRHTFMVLHARYRWETLQTAYLIT